MSQRSLKVSVTALADFSCRVGDLELAGTVGPTARQGMKAHQRIQSLRLSESEVRLSTKITIQDVIVTLSGRVDLLETDQHNQEDLQNVGQEIQQSQGSALHGPGHKSRHRLSEIKTTLVPSHRLSQSKLALQWAQIKLYGFCYCRQLLESDVAVPSDGIELELIHADIRRDSEDSSVQNLTLDVLEAFALDALTRYVVWRKLLWSWEEDIKSSAAAMVFPHDQYRAGQRDMAAAAFRATRDGKTLLCEAPTGTGKTLSSLFPAIKALGEGYVKHVVYLTAKSSGRQSAMFAVRALEQAGLKITSIIIRSKSPTCFCTNGRCERDDSNVCPMTIGFFDRLPAAREEAINCGVVDGDQLDEIAWQHQVCPFELALQLLPWVSISIADYNYVFDPLVRIGRFSESRRDTALLIDEAHNLVDRARDMHSGHLNRLELLDGQQLVSSSHPLLAKKIKSLCNSLKIVNKSNHALTSVDEEVPKNLVTQSSAVVEAYVEALDQGPVLPESLFEIFKMTCRFIAISDLYNAQHKTVTQVEKVGRQTQVVVNLKCLDAASYLKPQYKLFRSTLVFSATLRPAPFYRDALGLDDEAQQLVLGSPFSVDQVSHCVVNYINTRYRHRSASIPDLVNLLHTLVNSKPGNYMVFFPSYAYLEEVYAEFVKKHPGIDTWHQPRNADIEERMRLLGELEVSGTRLGFAILGGVFGEGIDYVGDRLIGVVLVGVGLPGLGVEQDLIAECYKEQGLDGFDYAYRYPGFTKVLQTAGRVIRTESDRGVIILVDDRFSQAFYRGLYPDHWLVETASCPDDVELKLKRFWDVQSQLDL